MLTRRDFLKVTGGVAAAAGLASAVYALIKNDARNPVFEQVTIPFHNLHPDLEDIKIAHLSDIHLSALVHTSQVEYAVEQINRSQPDLVALTGDFVWHDLNAIYTLAPLLGKLRARYGVFACLGNHDLWTNAAVISRALESVGITVLINRGIEIQKGGARLWIAGLDDAMMGRPDLEQALSGADQESTVVLLAHEPDMADRAASDGRVDVQLSGHSHGGQIRLPGFGALILPFLGRKYSMGLYRIGSLWLYTNRGLGVTQLPLRLNCPPEITGLTFTRA